MKLRSRFPTKALYFPLAFFGNGSWIANRFYNKDAYVDPRLAWYNVELGVPHNGTRRPNTDLCVGLGGPLHLFTSGGYFTDRETIDGIVSQVWHWTDIFMDPDFEMTMDAAVFLVNKL